MKNSADSPAFSAKLGFEAALAVWVLVVLVALWAWWTYQHGYILYYGDAQAHLNNSRSILDSRRPGYDQLGTVWLPLLHLLCLPFVQNNFLWSSGLAGTIPVACCFVIAGLFLYLSARELNGKILPAVVALACFALNPNILYLAVIPMTEVVFLAGFAVLLYAAIRFGAENRRLWLFTGIGASCWMSLTRYDGWFLIPFASAWFAYLEKRSRLKVFAVFLSLASLPPIYWIVNSWYETANPFDFYNGPYSAKAIQHGAWYPGFHDWPMAFLYYGKASQLCAGWGLVVVGAAGLLLCRQRRSLPAMAFLLLPCAFYVWSIHSSGNPIHVPQLWPFSYYNTRYGTAFVFFASFAAGSLAERLLCYRPALALTVLFLSVLPWSIHPSQEKWICWKESKVNSDARRAWTTAGARFLNENYKRGDGILAAFGDLAGIFCRSQIPLAEVLHEGGGPDWLASTTRAELIHPQRWAVTQEGDLADRALSPSHSAPYHISTRIRVPGAPVLNIYKRDF